MREKVEMLPRVLPFVLLLIGVMVALYGGFATPSETAGLGAVLALVLIADRVRRLAAARPGADPRVDAQGVDDADADHRHVAAVLVRDELPAHQPGGREWIVGLHLSRWVLLAMILLMVIVLGFFLPPVSIILMTDARSSCRRSRPPAST